MAGGTAAGAGSLAGRHGAGTGVLELGDLRGDVGRARENGGGDEVGREIAMHGSSPLPLLGADSSLECGEL